MLWEQSKAAPVWVDTYLTRADPALEWARAHLVLTNAASEVSVALPVAENRYLGHVEDGLISSPLKKNK